MVDNVRDFTSVSSLVTPKSHENTVTTDENPSFYPRVPAFLSSVRQSI